MCRTYVRVRVSRWNERFAEHVGGERSSTPTDPNASFTPCPLVTFVSRTLAGTAVFRLVSDPPSTTANGSFTRRRWRARRPRFRLLVPRLGRRHRRGVSNPRMCLRTRPTFEAEPGIARLEPAPTPSGRNLRPPTAWRRWRRSRTRAPMVDVVEDGEGVTSPRARSARVVVGIRAPRRGGGTLGTTSLRDHAARGTRDSS